MAPPESAAPGAWTSNPPVTPMQVPATPPATGRSAASVVLAVITIVALLAVGTIVVWSLMRDPSPESSQAESPDDPRQPSGGNQPAGDQQQPGSEGQPADEQSGDREQPENPATTGSRLVDTCGESDLLSIPGTDISIEPLSSDQEIEIGESARADILGYYVAGEDAGTESMLTDLLDELQPASPHVPYSVTLLDSDEVNAFAIPGGGIFFTTSIVDLMSEDQLAFVMAHEISHVECRHIAHQIEREALAAAGLSAVLGQEIDPEDLYSNSASAALTSLATLGFSRDDESEADLAALDLLEAAGRPLGAAVGALEVLRDLEGGADPSTVEVLLSTHPGTQDRIEDLDDEIANR